MCGIAGFWNRNGMPASRLLLEQMTRTLAHRGPDGEGFWTEGGVALGHRRLAIRDISRAGSQPFHSACGHIVVTYNGEIYNDAEIERRLVRETGFERRTRCDTELIPAGYLAWGEDVFSMLEGMFAIALWDRTNETLILARDNIGIKPLYVADEGATIRFGSEIKAILADPSVSMSWSAPDIATMLALGHTAPTRTMFTRMRQIAPGTVETFTKASHSKSVFWQPHRKPVAIKPEDALDHLQTLVANAVKDQLISDVPVGVLQSGGVDSSIVSLSLPQAAESPLFCLRFASHSHDESAAAARVAKAAGRPLILCDLPDNPADLAEAFSSVVHHVDGHLADSSLLAAYRLAGAVRGHVAVALTGDGGDEFFCGYPTYEATRLASRFSYVPKSFFKPLAMLARGLSRPSDSRISNLEKAERLLGGLASPVAHAAWRQYLTPRDRHRLYGSALRPLLAQDPLADYAAAFEVAPGDPVDKALIADQSFYLPADMLVKTDRMSMAHGLELRVPLLDRRIMEFANTLPRSLLFQGFGKSKLILRYLFQKLGGPPDIVAAPKQGFNLPMNILLRGSLRPLAAELFERQAGLLEPWIDADGVRAIWAEHDEGRRDNKYTLWTLLTLFVWRQQQLGKASS
jgi:asparagine synthase (glutamine-hydrolysing)